MTTEHTQEYLDDLMDFISGKGLHAHLVGEGIHTYPGTGEKQDRIHSACEELERQGRVVRRKDEPGHAYFIANRSEPSEA